MTDAPTIDRPHARRRRPIDAKLRKRIERAVEKLITALDVLDAPDEDREGEPDEANGDEDEPSLGAAGLYEPRSQEDWSGSHQSPHEVDREMDSDDEPVARFVGTRRARARD